LEGGSWEHVRHPQRRTVAPEYARLIGFAIEAELPDSGGLRTEFGDKTAAVMIEDACRSRALPVFRRSPSDETG